ncbi:MAG: DUF2188 domain-containing protein [Thermoanaerobaculia bacterium]
MKKSIHVTHRKDGSWAVKGAGDERASSLHDTQGEAIEAARPLAEKNHSEIVIHGRDKKIRDTDSFGPDPNPPKDTKH